MECRSSARLLPEKWARHQGATITGQSSHRFRCSPWAGGKNTRWSMSIQGRVTKAAEGNTLAPESDQADSVPSPAICCSDCGRFAQQYLRVFIGKCCDHCTEDGLGWHVGQHEIPTGGPQSECTCSSVVRIDIPFKAQKLSLK